MKFYTVKGTYDYTVANAAYRHAEQKCRERANMIRAQYPASNYVCTDEEYSEFVQQYIEKHTAPIKITRG